MKYWIVDCVVPDNDKVTCLFVKVGAHSIQGAITFAEMIIRKKYNQFFITNIGLATDFDDNEVNLIQEDPIGLDDEDLEEIAQQECWK